MFDIFIICIILEIFITCCNQFNCIFMLNYLVFLNFFNINLLWNKRKSYQFDWFLFDKREIQIILYQLFFNDPFTETLGSFFFISNWKMGYWFNTLMYKVFFDCCDYFFKNIEILQIKIYISHLLIPLS